MKTIKELMNDHKKLVPNYEGSAVAPLPTYPERTGTLKSWAQFEKEQARIFRGKVGVKLDDWLERKS